MSWDFKPAFDAGHRASLADGKNFVYVCPPTWWALLPLLDNAPPFNDSRHHTLVLTNPALGITEAAQVIERSATAGSVHSATGLTRTGRLLRNGHVNTLVSTPADVLALLQQSAVNLGQLGRILIAWPEMMMEAGSADDLDSVLAEASGAQRIVATGDEATISDFLERHARRTPLVVASKPPAVPAASARYAVVEKSGIESAMRAALDIINPDSALIWDPMAPTQARWHETSVDPGIRVVSDPGTEPVDLAIAVRLPTAEALVQLNAVAGDTLILVRAAQIPYLRRITQRARALQLPDAVDRARDQAARLREEVRDLVERGRGSAELLALAPLFDTYDPATVAGALAAERRASPSTTVREQQMPTWVRLHANVGRQDHVSTGDIVGAVLNATGVSKRQVGKVELRDRFALIEVRAEIAQEVLRGLNGLQLKGKKVTARVDRR